MKTNVLAKLPPMCNSVKQRGKHAIKAHKQATSSKH